MNRADQAILFFHNYRDTAVVSMGGHFHRTDRDDSSIQQRQLAESHLTQRLFGQILGRIERLAGHPT